MNTPKAYTQGWIEFYKLRFKVTPDVLIPRPETELLIDEVLNYIKENKKENIIVLDVGTGSGAIAISITKNLSASQTNTQIIATDISKEALKVAKQNAKLHGVLDKITFIQSDLLSDLDPSTQESTGLFPTQDDNLIIVTNLPYIPTERIPYLDSSVKDFEPFIALDGGEDGFELYRKLFSQIVKKGWKPKLLVGEIDYTHGELAIYEAQKYFPKSNVEVIKDLAHLQRILKITF
ncbi:MAG: peptide chain release factor N(5)-glutamine methyltransferase [Candidatus Daviesbacteria bacterium]|nr:peptide chain release factor N(5)-glutamine methyltransferase [Candidatus Daviesbacteria bacterium]